MGGNDTADGLHPPPEEGLRQHADGGADHDDFGSGFGRSQDVFKGIIDQGGSGNNQPVGRRNPGRGFGWFHIKGQFIGLEGTGILFQNAKRLFAPFEHLQIRRQGAHHHHQCLIRQGYVFQRVLAVAEGVTTGWMQAPAGGGKGVEDGYPQRLFQRLSTPQSRKI
ncbi:MAG: hypothetical protein BWY71_02417 [Planctomycetes bacterium ADurb.Bin412]|nr:MAG: hypothetical protein BWY71_02417 [Planctomycetes bacterium ADurb.Bin412]